MRKRRGIDMSPSQLGNTNQKKKTFLTDARRMIQKTIKEKGLTNDQIEKSLNGENER